MWDLGGLDAFGREQRARGDGLDSGLESSIN
jgi:hypothetical protein